ncbi:M20 family peptidase, partial [Enterococcus faecalis]|nr:M20 family peptidase [Enterococcus faecalis]
MKAIQKNFQKKLKINQQLAYDLNDFLARNPEISGQEFQSVAYILSVLKKKNILI